jgi:hypothetical protein
MPSCRYSAAGGPMAAHGRAPIGPAGGVAQRRDRREQNRTVRAVEQREAAGAQTVHDTQAVIVSLWTLNAVLLSRPASRTIPRLAATSSREGPRPNCRRVCRNQLVCFRAASELSQTPNLVREHLRSEWTPARGRPVRPAR